MYETYGLTNEDIFRLGEMLILGIVAVLIILCVIRPLFSAILECEEERSDHLQEKIDRALIYAEILIDNPDSSPEELRWYLDQMVRRLTGSDYVHYIDMLERDSKYDAQWDVGMKPIYFDETTEENDEHA